MDYLSLCLICKDENDYLPEWLDYHILMGVERFYIYDNESKIGIRQTLKEYVDTGRVVVMDYPGHKVQLYAYDHCLRVYGQNTFWMGFIDTDEFFVPRTALDLRTFLRDYEAHAGLAVSSVFFGSSGHAVRPPGGQISSYTKRVHPSFKENEFIKSIVQPRLTALPNSPHDFVYRLGNWCVNENLTRVDDQRFPHSAEKIQLNHYFCRSQEEIELKLQRGGGARKKPWARERFTAVNSFAKYEERIILENLSKVLGVEFSPESMIEKIHQAVLSKSSAVPVSSGDGLEPLQSQAMQDWAALKERSEKHWDAGEFLLYVDTLKEMSAVHPHHISLYVGMSTGHLSSHDPEAAWQALTKAWAIAPGSYMVLFGMCNYFLAVKNYAMAEKTSRLLQGIAPDQLIPLGFLTEALAGLGRYEDALKVGVPVVELAAKVGELLDGMAVYLVRLLADHLVKKDDYAGAAQLWELGVRCEPANSSAHTALGEALLLAGNKTAARRSLSQAQALDPLNEKVKKLLASLR